MATKYFFGYFSFHGNRNSTAWIEVDGHPVGHRPEPLKGNIHEITLKQFSWTIADLEDRYPFKEVPAETPPSK